MDKLLEKSRKKIAEISTDYVSVLHENGERFIKGTQIICQSAHIGLRMCHSVWLNKYRTIGV